MSAARNEPAPELAMVLYTVFSTTVSGILSLKYPLALALMPGIVFIPILIWASIDELLLSLLQLRSNDETVEAILGDLSELKNREASSSKSDSNLWEMFFVVIGALLFLVLRRLRIGPAKVGEPT